MSSSASKAFAAQFSAFRSMLVTRLCRPGLTTDLLSSCRTCFQAVAAKAMTECEAWKAQAFSSPASEGRGAGTDLEARQAMASKDGQEQGMKRLEQILSVLPSKGSGLPFDPAWPCHAWQRQSWKLNASARPEPKRCSRHGSVSLRRYEASGRASGKDRRAKLARC